MEDEIYEIIQEALKKKAFQDAMSPVTSEKVYVAKANLVNQKAMERYIQEIEDLKKQRQKEKDIFFSGIQIGQNLNENKKYNMRVHNRQYNDYLINQIERNQLDKSERASRDREYSKPHYGPEETLEIIDAARRAELKKKELIRKYLEMQMEDRKFQHDSKLTRERKFDNTYLMNTKATQKIEDIVKE